METISSGTEDQFERSLRRLDEALHFSASSVPTSSDALPHFRSKAQRSSLAGATQPYSDQSPASSPVTCDLTAFGLTSRTLLSAADFTVDLSVIAAGTRAGAAPGEDDSVAAGSESTMAMPDDGDVRGSSAVTSGGAGGAGDELCRHFFDSRRALAGALHTPDLLHSYQLLCQQRLDRLGRQLRLSAHQQLSQLQLPVSGERQSVDAEQLPQLQRLWQQLQLERDTWRLLAALLADEMSTAAAAADDDDDEDGSQQQQEAQVFCDPAAAVAQLFERDQQVRRAQLVVDWLERCAADQLQSGYHERVEFFSDAPTGWENTLHALRRSATSSSATAESQLTPCLDPDAPMRLQRHLHGVDAEDDQRLLRYVFALLRAGRLSEAQQLCVRVGQAWRAATLDGWKLYCDTNLSCRRQQQQQSTSAEADDDRQVPSGNRLRRLWRLAAWRLAERVDADRYERAVYGALCGNVAPVLTVCVSWEDRVWALLRHTIDSRVSSQLRALTVAGALRQPMAMSDQLSERLERQERCLRDNNSDQRDLTALFDEVDTLMAAAATATTDTSNTATAAAAAAGVSSGAAETRRLFNRLQRQAVLSDTGGMMTTLATWCSDCQQSPPSAPPPPLAQLMCPERREMLRAAAHMALLLRSQSSADDTDDHLHQQQWHHQLQSQCDVVLNSYVRQLVADAAIEPAVWFTARVASDRLRVHLLRDMMAAVDAASLSASRQQLPAPGGGGQAHARLADPSARQLVLQLAERAGLPVAAACCQLVRASRRCFVTEQLALATSAARKTVGVATSSSTTITATGSKTVSCDEAAAAIGWLLHDPALRVEAVAQTNALCRALLLTHSVSAAGQLSAQLPEDSVAVIHRQYSVDQYDGGQLPPIAAAVVRELLCVRALLLALQSYEDWSEQFHKRPQPPPPPQPSSRQPSSASAGAGSSFAEGIVHEQRLRQYRTAELRWRSSHEALTQTACERLYNVLLFPDGGWMCDDFDADSDSHFDCDVDTAAAAGVNRSDDGEASKDHGGDQHRKSDPVLEEMEDRRERARQMATLRSIYLPQTVFVLQTVLRAADRPCEALQLADVVASERHAIYRHFSGQDLRSFLRGLRDICLPLLDTQHDALGYRQD